MGGGGEAGGGDGVSGRGGEMVVVTASVALMAKRRLLQQMPFIKWVVVGRSFVQCRKCACDCLIDGLEPRALP